MTSCETQVIQGLSAQDHLLEIRTLNNTASWFVWVKAQLQQPTPVTLVGQLEEELGWNQEELEHALGAVSDHESDVSDMPVRRTLRPYIDGPWNDYAAARSSNQAAASSSNQETSQSEREQHDTRYLSSGFA